MNATGRASIWMILQSNGKFLQRIVSVIVLHHNTCTVSVESGFLNQHVNVYLS